MSNITADQIKLLREHTGAGLLDAKRALSESLGDFGEAIEWLRYKGTSYPYVSLMQKQKQQEDTRVRDLEVKLARAIEGLTTIDQMSSSHMISSIARATLADIKEGL